MKILLVEDSDRLQRSISSGLRALSYAVDQAYDGQQALEFIARYQYEAIILDLMLPKLSGLSVLKQMRAQNNNTHVLILSARDRTEDRVEGLDFGADDYLIKPFSFDELVSRLRALSRRCSDYRKPDIQIGDLFIDSVAHRASWCGEPINLTPSEFSLLQYLASRRGHTASQQQLIEQLRDAATDININTIEVHISSLRRKLKKAGLPALIKTHRGFGYQIE